MDGALLVDKPAGISSARVVSRLKRHFSFSKVGHAGTLDPFASGLLVVLCGKATRLQELFLEGDKEYEGLIRLGVATDSDDITGNIIARDENFSKERLSAGLAEIERKFSGEQSQIPPQISAIHLDGKRSYARARAGEVVVHEPRKVIIHSLELSLSSPNQLFYRMRCSKGTYVRSLARDIGQFLGTVACVETLRRTVSEPFSLGKAHTLAELEELSDSSAHSIPISLLVHDFARCELPEDQWKLLSQGDQRVLRQLPFGDEAKRAALFGNEGQFLGLIERDTNWQEGAWKVRFLNT